MLKNIGGLKFKKNVIDGLNASYLFCSLSMQISRARLFKNNKFTSPLKMHKILKVKKYVVDGLNASYIFILFSLNAK
jgi:hypothetical protein